MHYSTQEGGTQSELHVPHISVAAQHLNSEKARENERSEKDIQPNTRLSIRTPVFGTSTISHMMRFTYVLDKQWCNMLYTSESNDSFLYLYSNILHNS